MFVSTKTYKDLGPVCYRQWKADSHCNLLHGYSLSFHIQFESETLDVRNWVVDYGSLRSFRFLLEDWFDHKLVVAEDDPAMDEFVHLKELGLAKLTIVERTGCEGLAKYIFDYLETIWLPENGYKNTDHEVFVRRVEVAETGANMAFYERTMTT